MFIATSGFSFFMNQFNQYPMINGESVWFSWVVCFIVYIFLLSFVKKCSMALTLASIWNVCVLMKIMGCWIILWSSSFLIGNIHGSNKTQYLNSFRVDMVFRAVAPPKEWPIIIKLSKSSLPVKCSNLHSLFTSEGTSSKTLKKLVPLLRPTKQEKCL